MLNGNGTAPKVVVVGGSLGGLFNAIALRSLGCEVEVFEKSSGLMKDRGAGIVFQQEVADFLARYEVAPLESVVVPVRTRRYLEADGSVAQEGPMPQAMTSWDVLYRKLRAAFGDDHYHVGVRLVGFETTNDKVTARFEGGREEACDLLVGADGPGSTVRQQLLPSVRSEYAGYVAWRGVVMEHQAPDLAAEFADRFTFFQAPHTHILCYLIPGPDGSLHAGAAAAELGVVSERRPWRRTRPGVDRQGRATAGVLGPAGNGRSRHARLATRSGPAHPAAFIPAAGRGDGGAVRADDPRPRRAGDGVRAGVPDRGCGLRPPAPHGGEYGQGRCQRPGSADCLTATGGDVVEALRRREPDEMELGERLWDYGSFARQPSQFDR